MCCIKDSVETKIYRKKTGWFDAFKVLSPFGHSILFRSYSLYGPWFMSPSWGPGIVNAFDHKKQKIVTSKYSYDTCENMCGLHLYTSRRLATDSWIRIFGLVKIVQVRVRYRDIIAVNKSKTEIVACRCFVTPESWKKTFRKEEHVLPKRIV